MNDNYESIQLTLFTWAQPSVDALGAWSALGRGSPVGFQTAPNGQQTNVQGVVDGNQIQVIVQANRIDIVVQGIMSQSPSAASPEIVDVDAAFGLALESADTIARMIKVGRVASVWQSNEIANSREDAVTKFNARTARFKAPSASVGAGVEITVPLQSQIKAERILTRLCKWQTVQSQFIQFNQQGPVAAAAPLTLFAFGSHAYVDVYFEAPESLQPDDAMAALREVSGEARRIIDGGPDALYG